MASSSQKVAASSLGVSSASSANTAQPLGLASLFPDDDNDDIEVIDGGRAVIDVVANNSGGAAVLHAPAMPAGRQLDGGDAPQQLECLACSFFVQALKSARFSEPFNIFF